MSGALRRLWTGYLRWWRGDWLRLIVGPSVVPRVVWGQEAIAAVCLRSVALRRFAGAIGLTAMALTDRLVPAILATGVAIQALDDVLTLQALIEAEAADGFLAV